MSVADTMYEESVKLGFGKLLSSQTITSSVPAIVFVAPFASGFNCFHFDIVYMYSDTATVPGFQTSPDGGASWYTSYWWSLIYAGASGGLWGSQGNVVVGATQVFSQIGGGGETSNPHAGEVIIYRHPNGSCNYQFHTACNTSTNNQHYIAGGGAQDSYMNAVRFLMLSGNISRAIIRCYGLRTGA